MVGQAIRRVAHRELTVIDFYATIGAAYAGYGLQEQSSRTCTSRHRAQVRHGTSGEAAAVTVTPVRNAAIRPREAPCVVPILALHQVGVRALPRVPMSLGAWIAASLTLCALTACGGDSNDGAVTPPSPAAQNFLMVTDVERVIAQAVAEAQARNAKATIAVVDRVGNVLGVFKMNGAASFTITSQTGAQGGLEGITGLPPEFAAISMAVTGAYLSSGGNAFSTRTASQIIQSHFNPEESNQPGGPLFGVQFSQLTCSDLVRHPSDGTVGPKPAPLGLAAEPGGLPLYKNGTVVGAIGVMATGIYSLDLDIIDNDANLNEAIAVAGSQTFEAPAGVRADHINVDGRSLRFVDSGATPISPANVPAFATIGARGSLVNVSGYGGDPIVAGVAWGTPASGVRPDTNPAFAGLNAYVLVDATDVNRYPPRAGTDGLLTAVEVTQILKSAISVANRARAQIRQPSGVPAEVSISVVDTRGAVLGFIRTPDAPLFGADVSLQKARSAALFSSLDAGAFLSSLPAANYAATQGLRTPLPSPPLTSVPIGSYVVAMRSFLADPGSLANGIAYGNRGVGNLARPFFPDGITGTAAGPLSVAAPNWSVFNVGLQLDLVVNAVVASTAGPVPPDCVGGNRVANGIQIFPGSVPIYRGALLVGAIGISGDGIDQDDMVAFLGLANAGSALDSGIANAPPAIRNDTIVPGGEGTRLRYVNCPQAPFNGSNDQNVCSGI